MGTVRDLAHSADSINWDARQRVNELSTRPAAPEYMQKHSKRIGDFVAALFCLGAAVLLVATYVIWI